MASFVPHPYLIQVANGFPALQVAERFIENNIGPTILNAHIVHITRGNLLMPNIM